MATNISGAPCRAAYAVHPQLGMLCSPRYFRLPWCHHWAADNDMFNHSDDPAWWNRQGEKAWLKMLDKLTAGPLPSLPLFCALPDVVANWPLTLERSYHYRHEIEARGWKPALVLQDGCKWEDVNDFASPALFVGGSKFWKWANVRTIISRFGGSHWVHVGRVNGIQAIRLVRQWGAHSADGTGLARHFDAELPKVLAGLYTDRTQLQPWQPVGLFQESL